MASKFVKIFSKLIGSQKLQVVKDLKSICVEIEDARMASELSFERGFADRYDNVPFATRMPANDTAHQSSVVNAPSPPPPYICCNHQCGLLTSSSVQSTVGGVVSTSLSAPPPYML